MLLAKFVMVAALAIVPAVSWAQMAYDAKCCPEFDCRAADPHEVTQVRGGFFVSELDEVFSASDARVMPSRDGRFHLCLRSAANPGMAATRAYALLGRKKLKCLYVPALF